MKTFRCLMSALFLVALVIPARAKGKSETLEDMQCMLEMKIPQYGIFARRALTTGTVEARVNIGEGGLPEEIRTTAPDRNLSAEVEHELRRTAKFRSDCVGKEIKLLFTFRLEGQERDYTFDIISFRPPNHFLITSQPQKPHILYWPIPPRERQPKTGERKQNP